MHQALYRKWRPMDFDSVCGQEHITDILKYETERGLFCHAYLFCGTRGTGKTSTAKIFARAINCTNPTEDGEPCNECAVCQDILAGRSVNVIEIDAASNNGVDNVRDLRDDAIYTPSQVKMRVYIIDEVHMLSISAFNALLKIIEEPPEHLLFILATTELHKVPATILSRCQRFSFRRISQEDIAARLQYVAYQENIDLDDSAARVIARLADGGMRDGLSLLDQCASATTGELTAERVYQCLGIAGEQKCGELMGYIANHDTKKALELFNRLYTEGKDLSAMLDEMACMCRDQMATDGFTLWGGYPNGVYFPSKRNIFLPANIAANFDSVSVLCHILLAAHFIQKHSPLGKPLSFFPKRCTGHDIRLNGNNTGFAVHIGFHSGICFF